MTPQQIYFEQLGNTVVKALKARHFDAYYCKDRTEAAKLIQSLIPETDTVAWGGSMTIEALGLIDWARGHRKVIDRDKAANREEKLQLMRESLLCDTYLMSSNAVTADGQLYNIDANGNRVAALTFGPRQVIVAVGMNKVAPTLEEAVSRARNTAAPVNVARFGLQTPCASTGQCADCKSPQSICCSFVRTRLCNVPGRIKVVLVGENLGF
ncbi:MAG: lactate utilization protein [Paludibacteraceae bacterium]|nr:lactate utilization protein [Paludibacteraceae bacterium]